MSTIRSRRALATNTWPQTIPGKWSVATFGIFLLGAVGLFVAAATGQTGGEAILDNLWLGIPALVGLMGATSSMITGLTAVVSRRERSAVVLLTATVSTLALIFVALTVTLG